MKKGRGEGKEREVPMHLIEISKLTHAARVTKKKIKGITTWYVAKKK